MKKIFSYILLFVAAASSMMVSSCCDNDGKAAGTDRQFMTMFISDNTRGKGNDYPYNSDLDASFPHGNTIHLYWYGVKDCAGYQIQMALPIKVANGADAWARVQGTPDLLLDTIVGPEVLDMLLPDLQYSTDYRFAIRALSTLDQNVLGDESTFAHASNWYGHGNGRQWAEYLNIKTKDRYHIPYAVYVDQSLTTEHTMHVCINPNVKDFIKVFEGMTDPIFAQIDALNPITLDGVLGKFPNISSDDKDKLESYFTNFNVADDGTFGYKYLRVQPSPSNPTSTVGDKWKYYEITDADRAHGFIDIDGLTPNSVYVIDVIDPTVSVAIDAKYNTCTTRSDGTPGDPILLNHDQLIAEQGPLPEHPELKRSDVFAAAAQYDAAPLTPTLHDFISNTNYAEGQEFMLEGGKTYYIDGNDITCKGFVLRTNPADVAKGLRAKVICGIGDNATVFTQASVGGAQWSAPYSMFMFGRSPEAGEGGEIYMKKLAFYDIDFDNPTAVNYGEQAAGIGNATGNYFFNMFSNGMAVTLEELIIDNCSFKRLVRGFIREQGPNYKKWNRVVIHNNQFFDCGYYNQNAGGYGWIAGAGTNPETNLYLDFECTENTFYDSPFPSFFTETAQSAWVKGTKWNITFSNNTLVNFNTRGAGNIFSMRYLPDGATFNVENNLMVLCKQPGDVRTLDAWGADIRETQTYEDGSAGVVNLNFHNNWCTAGSNFTANAWNATSNNFGKLVKDEKARLNGQLELNEAKITAEELFISPCPPHKAASSTDRHMHRADALDGTAAQYNVNLFYKNMSNEIVENKVGAARWRVAK